MREPSRAFEVCDQQFSTDHPEVFQQVARLERCPAINRDPGRMPPELPPAILIHRWPLPVPLSPIRHIGDQLVDHRRTDRGVRRAVELLDPLRAEEPGDGDPAQGRSFACSPRSNQQATDT